MCRQIDEDRAEINQKAIELSKLLIDRKTLREQGNYNNKHEAKIEALGNEISDIFFRADYLMPYIEKNEEYYFSILIKKKYSSNVFHDVFLELIGKKTDNSFFDYSRYENNSFLNALNNKLKFREKDFRKEAIKSKRGEVLTTYGKQIDKLSEELLEKYIAEYEEGCGFRPSNEVKKILENRAKEDAEEEYAYEYGRVFLDSTIDDDEGDSVSVGNNIADSRADAEETIEEYELNFGLMPIFLQELSKSFTVIVGKDAKKQEPKKLKIFKAAYTHEIIVKTEKGKQTTENLKPDSLEDMKKKMIIDTCQLLKDSLIDDGYYDNYKDIFIKTGISSLMFDVMHLGYVTYVKGGNEAYYNLYKVMKPVIETNLKSGIVLIGRNQRLEIISAVCGYKTTNTVGRYLGERDERTISEYDEFRKKVKEDAIKKYEVTHW